jgi:hypothetical protein
MHANLDESCEKIADVTQRARTQFEFQNASESLFEPWS